MRPRGLLRRAQRGAALSRRAAGAADAAAHVPTVAAVERQRRPRAHRARGVFRAPCHSRAAGALNPIRACSPSARCVRVEREHIVHIGDDPRPISAARRTWGYPRSGSTARERVGLPTACPRYRRARPGRAGGVARRVVAPLERHVGVACQRRSVRRFAIHRLPVCTVFANFGS